jgi:hypothetical protein
VRPVRQLDLLRTSFALALIFRHENVVIDALFAALSTTFTSTMPNLKGISITLTTIYRSTTTATIPRSLSKSSPTLAPDFCPLFYQNLIVLAQTETLSMTFPERTRTSLATKTSRASVRLASAQLANPPGHPALPLLADNSKAAVTTPTKAARDAIRMADPSTEWSRSGFERLAFLLWPSERSNKTDPLSV